MDFALVSHNFDLAMALTKIESDEYLTGVKPREGCEVDDDFWWQLANFHNPTTCNKLFTVYIP